MGINSEHVLCMWRFIRLFINTSYVISVERHPFVSCTLLITFLIYISFNLLLHHLPFLILVALLLRLFWSSERQQPDHRHVKESEKSDSSLERGTSVKAIGAATREIPSFRRQKSRRTYFSKNNIIQGNDTKPPVVPESKRAKVLHGDQREQDQRPGFTRPNYFSSEDDSEETNVKAVEWTEEDQRNLDNLGVSEIERNRRLESLIAKRRARNQDRPPITTPTTTTVDPSRSTRKITPRKPIFVPRTIGGDGSEKVPGSAPSVLAAGKNPFDIPYDPSEEKPDLTAADSLFDHGDFLAGNCQNERGGPNPMYCRHESFSYGGLFGGQFESERDRREAKLSAFFGAGESGLSRISGNDRLIEQLLGTTKSHMDNTPSMVETVGTQCPTQTVDSKISLDSEISNFDRETETTNDTTFSEQDALIDKESANNVDTMTEADTEQSIVEDSETTSSSSLDVSIANRSMEAIASLESMQGYSHEDSSMIPTSYSNDKNTNIESVDDRFFFGNKLSTHTPSYSLASDLHVEVSEIDSPPLTVGNITPNDRDSLSFDDDEMERARLNFDIESLDDINQALERVGNSRGSLDELADENREMETTSLAERLSSHPFFESVYGTREETLFRPDNSVEENTVNDSRDLGTNFMDDMKGQENNEHGDILISEETTKPSDSEGNPQNRHQHQSPSDSSTQQPIVVNTDTNVAKNNNHDEAKDEHDPNSNGINNDTRVEKSCVKTALVEQEQESLIEEVVVNSSSPSSPLSTPVRLIPVHKVFSSNLDAKSDAKPLGHKEVVASTKIINEANIVLDKVELGIEEKAGAEESRSIGRVLEINSSTSYNIGNEKEMYNHSN